jgi:hypothetical protein
MYYQILGPPMPFCPPNYRGTYRCGPAFQEEQPETAPVNCAWREYVSQAEKLADRDLALRLAAAFEAVGFSFDVVQLDKVASNPPLQSSAGLIGFDIAQHGWYSLLSWGLHWGGDPPLGPPPLGPLLALVEAYFRPLLNRHGLFATWADARFFLDVAEAISALAPGTWEAPGHEKFAIVQLVAIKLAPGPTAQGGNGAPRHQTTYAASPDQ